MEEAAYGPTHSRTDPGVLVTGISPSVTVALLWELFLQCGHVTRVQVFRDRARAFVDFAPAPSVILYVCLALDGVVMCGRSLTVRPNDESEHEFAALRADSGLHVALTLPLLLRPAAAEAVLTVVPPGVARRSRVNKIVLRGIRAAAAELEEGELDDAHYDVSSAEEEAVAEESELAARRVPSAGAAAAAAAPAPSPPRSARADDAAHLHSHIALAFGAHGEPLEVRLIAAQHGDATRRVAFVTMRTREQAARAAAALDGQVLRTAALDGRDGPGRDGRAVATMRVSWSKRALASAPRRDRAGVGHQPEAHRLPPRQHSPQRVLYRGAPAGTYRPLPAARWQPPQPPSPLHHAPPQRASPAAYGWYETTRSRAPAASGSPAAYAAYVAPYASYSPYSPYAAAPPPRPPPSGRW